MTLALHPDPTRPRLLAVDDPIVPEGARWELLNGERLMTPPAEEGHSSQHRHLVHMLTAHVADGWTVALDLLTRTSEDTNFAPDASIYPTARDPDTGGRQLEALAFEIVSAQSMAVVTRKARALVDRGVRRVFAIKLRKRTRTLLEFNAKDDLWTTLPDQHHLQDPVLAVPLHVHALLDATDSNAAVARALLARQEPEIMAPIAEQRRRADNAEVRAQHEQARAEHEQARAEHEQARAEAAEAERDAMARELVRLRATRREEPTD